MVSPFLHTHARLAVARWFPGAPLAGGRLATGHQHAETQPTSQYDVRCGGKWFIVAQSGAQWMEKGADESNEESGRCSSGRTLQSSTRKAA